MSGTFTQDRAAILRPQPHQEKFSSMCELKPATWTKNSHLQSWQTFINYYLEGRRSGGDVSLGDREGQRLGIFDWKVFGAWVLAAPVCIQPYLQCIIVLLHWMEVNFGYKPLSSPFQFEIKMLNVFCHIVNVIRIGKVFRGHASKVLRVRADS